MNISEIKETESIDNPKVKEKMHKFFAEMSVISNLNDIIAEEQAVIEANAVMSSKSTMSSVLIYSVTAN